MWEIFMFHPVYRVVVGKPRERDNLEDPSVDGRII